MKYKIISSVLQVLNALRSLYKPIQPTAKKSDDGVNYIEVLPMDALQHCIYCYWQLNTTKPLNHNFNYTVVADGCIDIFFELHQPQESFIMGFCKNHVSFDLGTTFNYVGIRFFPTVFPQLFKVNAAKLSNSDLDLHLIVPEIAAFIKNRFNEKQEMIEIQEILNLCFRQILADSKFDCDNRLYKAIEVILKKKGVLDVEKDLDTGVSYRQLQRLFKYYVGATPKNFSTVVRFQNVLNSRPSLQNQNSASHFQENGYYDQAHFIKEFKKFYGLTPSKVFGK